jgi:hypothetical protein
MFLTYLLCSGGGSGGKKPNDNKKLDHTSGSSGSSRSQDKDNKSSIEKACKHLSSASEKSLRDLSNEISRELKYRDKENKK